MESKETIRAAKVLLVTGGLLIVGIVVGFILAGQLNLSPQPLARAHSPRSRIGLCRRSSASRASARSTRGPVSRTSSRDRTAISSAAFSRRRLKVRGDSSRSSR